MSQVIDDTCYSPIGSLFNPIDMTPQDKEHGFNNTIIEENTIPPKLKRLFFYILLEFLGRPYEDIMKYIYDELFKKGSVYNIHRIFSINGIFSIPTKEECQFIKSCFDLTKSESIDIYNGCPELERPDSWVYALIRSGVFGGDIPNINCFEEYHSINHYNIHSDFLGFLWNAYVKGSRENKDLYHPEIIDEIEEAREEGEFVYYPECIPEIIRKSQEIRKRSICLRMEPKEPNKLIIITHPTKKMITRLFARIAKDKESINGFIIIGDQTSNYYLSYKMIDLFRSIGFECHSTGDRSTVHYNDFFYKGSKRLMEDHLGLKHNSNQYFFVNRRKVKEPIKLRRMKIFDFEDALTFLMISHSYYINVFGITYDIRLESLNNIIVLARKKYINPLLTDDFEKEPRPIPKEVFTIFIQEVQKIKGTLSRINIIKSKNMDKIQIMRDPHRVFYKELYEKMKYIDMRTDITYTIKLIEEIHQIDSFYSQNIDNLICSICIFDKKIVCRDCEVVDKLHRIANRGYCSAACQSIDVELLNHKPHQCQILKDSNQIRKQVLEKEDAAKEAEAAAAAKLTSEIKSTGL